MTVGDIWFGPGRSEPQVVRVHNLRSCLCSRGCGYEQHFSPCFNIHGVGNYGCRCSAKVLPETWLSSEGEDVLGSGSLEG